mmetsp:Transcript_41272/g.106858  ORF Transcript_41272/g.106858 Transcript_41272/m.106858 type:complete len:342 (+) Transcript_41272:913-1938(+)
MNLAREIATTISSMYSAVPVISDMITAIESVRRVTPETYAAAPMAQKTPGSMWIQELVVLRSAASPAACTASCRMEMPISLPTMPPMYIMGMKRPVAMAEPAMSAAKTYMSAKVMRSAGTEKKPLVPRLSSISKAMVPSSLSSVARSLKQYGTSSSSPECPSPCPADASSVRRWPLPSCAASADEWFDSGTTSPEMSGRYAGQGVAPSAISWLQFPGQRRLSASESSCSGVIPGGHTRRPWPLPGMWHTVGVAGKSIGTKSAMVVQTTITARGSAMRAQGTHRPLPPKSTARQRAMRVLMKVKGTARQPHSTPITHVPSIMMAMDTRSVSKAKRTHTDISA